jgi:small subunit ribosomal protein S20
VNAAASLDKPAGLRQKARPPNPTGGALNVANHKSAEKRNRQRIKRRARNLFYLSTLRTYMKRVRKSLDDGNVNDAKETLPKAVTAVAKAASRGVIHKNTAARYISRLNKAVARAS